MIYPSLLRTGTGSDSPLPPALVDMPGEQIQPLCCQIELYPSVEEGLFCLGLKVFLEEVPFEHLKDRNEEGQRRRILSRDRKEQRQGCAKKGQATWYSHRTGGR